MPFGAHVLFLILCLKKGRLLQWNILKNLSYRIYADTIINVKFNKQYIILTNITFKHTVCFYL
jgi:hypothetical protein